MHIVSIMQDSNHKNHKCTKADSKKSTMLRKKSVPVLYGKTC